MACQHKGVFALKKRRERECFQRSGFLVNPTFYEKKNHHKLFRVYFKECQVKYWTMFHHQMILELPHRQGVSSLTHCIMLRSKKSCMNQDFWGGYEGSSSIYM